MASEWRSSTWGAEISLEYGKSLRGYSSSEGKCRVFGSNGPIGWTSEFLAPGPGVILGRKGAYRGVNYSADPFFVIDTAYYVAPKSQLDMRWVYFAIRYHKLGDIDDGSPIPSTTRAAVYVRELNVPPLGEQRTIAKILGALDDKIELNRRMNDTLEAMARALFKAWFMDFDPVRAKALDLANEGVLEIGDGYRAKNSELGAPGLPFIRGGDLNNGFNTAGAEVLSQTNIAKAVNKISRTGDVAFTSKGTIGRFARVNEHTEKFVYSPQVCYWRSLDGEKLNPVVLYCWMTSGEFLTQILAISGQTDMAPYASLRDQRAMEVPIFPETQHDVAAKIEPLLRRQALLATETKTLVALRDTLLPKLISGELRVKAAKKIVEAVA